MLVYNLKRKKMQGMNNTKFSHARFINSTVVAVLKASGAKHSSFMLGGSRVRVLVGISFVLAEPFILLSSHPRRIPGWYCH
jgi:hypothetical protein